MRLPSAPRGGVQSLGRYQSEAGEDRALAGALVTVGQVVGQVGRIQDAEAERVAAEKRKDEERDARLAMSKASTEFDLNYEGRDEFSPDEIGDVETRTTEQAVINGGVREVARPSIPAYEVKPTMYKRDMEAGMQAAASKIEDPQQREEFIEDTQSKIDAQYANMVAGSRKEQAAYMDKKLNANISESVANQDFDAALILADDISNPEARADLKRQIKFTKENQYYDTLSLTADNPESWQAIQDSIVKLEDPEQSSKLSPAQREAKADKLKKSLALGVDKAQADIADDISRTVSDSKIALDQGKVIDTLEIDAMEDRGWITENERRQMYKQNAANTEAIFKVEDDKRMISIVAAYGGAIDPKNKDQRKAVNSIYAEQVADGADPWIAGVETMRTYAIVPDAVKSQLRASNRSDAPQLAQSARMYNQAAQYAPTALNDMPDSDIDVIQRVAANLSLGMSEADAVEMVRLIDNQSPEEKRTAKKTFEAARKDDKGYSVKFLSEKIDENLDNSWFGDPAIPMFAEQHFENLTEEYLAGSGYNVEAAQERAWATWKKQYSNSDINGKNTVMRYAPPANPEYVKKDIKSQLGDDVIIVGDQRTGFEISEGRKPTYRAYKQDGDLLIELERYEFDGAAINKKIEKEKAKQRDEWLQAGADYRATPKAGAAFKEMMQKTGGTIVPIRERVRRLEALKAEAGKVEI